MSPILASWLPPILFLPSVALVERAWMGGVSAPPSVLLTALSPTLAGMAAFAGRGQWGMSLFLAAWNLRAGMLVLGRRTSGSVAMPSFRAIHAFGRETRGWTACFVMVWLVEGLWGRVG